MCRYIFLIFLAHFYLGEFIEAGTRFQPVKMPSSCAKKTYCEEKSPNYPQELIDSLLVGIEANLQEVGNVSNPSHRLGMPSNECSVNTVDGEIYQMVDKDGNLRYVVQKKGSFEQKIQIEECVNNGRLMEQRNQLSENELKTNVFECKQKFLDLKFLVLSLDGAGLESVKMKNGVPVCCTCVLNKQNVLTTERAKQ